MSAHRKAFFALLVAVLIGGLSFSGADILFAQTEEPAPEPVVEEPAPEEPAPEEEPVVQATEDPAPEEGATEGSTEDPTPTEPTEGEEGTEGDTGTEGTEGEPGTEGDTSTEDPAPEEPTEGTDGEAGDSTDPATTEDGTEGDAADGSTDEDPTPVEGDAEVTTGDAEGDVEAGTQENTNDTTTDVPEDSETNVTNDNTGSADNDASVDVTSGSNTAAATNNATVDTGDAIASANVVNVVNTNIFNSEGLMYFLNVLMGNVSTDFRNIFSVLTGDEPIPDGGCTLEDCGEGNTTLNIENNDDGTVDNDVAVGAASGDNAAYAGAGNAVVSTGNAYASANVVNVVNTNITNSNYLLLSVNSFDSQSGDIIFPGADWFYDLLAQSASVPAGSNTTFINNNDAEVNTTGSVEAGTGDNEAASGAGAVVSTGDATAAATVVNKVNTNIFGDSLSFLFRIHGSWAGDIFGLPEGMSWRETDGGVEIFFEGDTVTAAAGSTDNLAVANNNTAVVNNNVNVFALTGGNYAKSEEGSAMVSTGDAVAAANVVNVVNTNVLGRNWVLAIFNIFGDWDGNIAFGQPDLWVGARAMGPSQLRGGMCFEYEVTVSNLGDADATNVVLSGLYSPIQQRIEKFQRDLDDQMTLHMGRIAAGTAETITLPACLSNYVPSGKEIVTEFEVDSDENDADGSNNNEAISVVTMPGGGGALRLGPAELEITKTSSDEVIRASSSVEYTIIIENKGDPVYHALLVDTIYDTSGKAIHEQRWGLETILAGETIIVSYEAFFNGESTPGLYTNEAFISGVDRNPDFETNLGNRVDSPVASVQIEVTEGELAPEACDQLLYTYIRRGYDNDVNEVSKLQYFLNSHEGESTLEMTGFFGEQTEAAVHRFQSKYASEVLTPWGIESSTGYVYYTTQKKVNEIWCGDLDYSFSDEQLAEIASFKNRVRAYEAAGIELPEEDLRRVGQAPADVSNALAVAETPTLDDEELSGSDQVANVTTLFESDTTAGLWDAIRSKVTGLWGWLSIQ